MQKYVLMLVCTALISACANTNQAETSQAAVGQNKPHILIREVYSLEQAGGQARIRLYGQNQKPTLMWHGIDCANNQHGTKVNVGGSFGDAFGSMMGTSKNESIGIAPTEISKNIGQLNGVLSKAIFREFAVQAGQPVNVQASYLGLSTRSETPTEIMTVTEGSCSGNIASFVPQAGHDYEVVSVKGKRCGVMVYEVSKTGGLTPIPLNHQYRCPR